MMVELKDLMKAENSVGWLACKMEKSKAVSMVERLDGPTVDERVRWSAASKVGSTVYWTADWKAVGTDESWVDG